MSKTLLLVDVAMENRSIFEHFIYSIDADQRANAEECIRIATAKWKEEDGNDYLIELPRYIENEFLDHGIYAEELEFDETYVELNFD